MERIPIISNAREELAEAVGSGQVSPPSPIACSPWIAMSLMQKAIRRGREDLALRAAATLLRDSPERLWRRSGIIAFEDIGVADLVTAGKVVAALGGKAFRAKLGGEWPVASTIVSAMARAPKCRAADNLLMIVSATPARGGAAHLRDYGDARPPRHRNRVEPPPQARARPNLRDRHRSPTLELLTAPIALHSLRKKSRSHRGEAEREKVRVVSQFEN